MRKRLKNKRRSCGLCKPHKRGMDNRWKPKDHSRMVQDTKEIRCLTRVDFLQITEGDK